jgi:two-component system response regulator DevR
MEIKCARLPAIGLVLLPSPNRADWIGKFLDIWLGRQVTSNMAPNVRPEVSPGRRSPTATTRIVVADRNVITRVGIRSILERNPGMAVVAEATTYDSVIDAIDEHGPDIMIIDLDLGDDTTRGLKICEEISDRYPSTRILILANTLSELIVIEALRRGANGYLCKDDLKADELSKGVKAIQDGDTVLGRGVGKLVAKSLGSTRDKSDHLTEREVVVIRAISRGLSNKQIAHELFISESTVKFHIQNASKKLHSHRRGELVHRANAAGLIA